MLKLTFLTALATAPASFAATPTPAVKETFAVPKTTTVSDFIKNRATLTANNAERIQKKKATAAAAAAAAVNTNNLRVLKGKKGKSEPKSKSKSKGSKNGPTSILYVGNSEADCSGVGLEAQAWVLGGCDRALSGDGVPMSREATSSGQGDALSLVFNYYWGDECEGDVVGTYDLADDLPPHTGLTYGDCIDGTGVTLSIVEGDINPGFDAIVEGYGAGFDSCSDGDFYEYNAVADGICYDEDARSFIYELDTCAETGTFKKTWYSDNDCTTFEEEITGSEEYEMCIFGFENLAEIASSGEPGMLGYRTTFCGYV